jgi:hypothetical protein
MDTSQSSYESMINSVNYRLSVYTALVQHVYNTCGSDPEERTWAQKQDMKYVTYQREILSKLRILKRKIATSKKFESVCIKKLNLLLQFLTQGHLLYPCPDVIDSTSYETVLAEMSNEPLCAYLISTHPKKFVDLNKNKNNLAKILTKVRDVLILKKL